MGSFQGRQNLDSRGLWHFPRSAFRPVAGTRAREPALPADFLPAIIRSAALHSSGDPISAWVVHWPTRFPTARAALAIHLSRGQPGSGRSAVHYRSAPPYAVQPGLEFRTTARLAWKRAHGIELRGIEGNATASPGGWQPSATGTGGSVAGRWRSAAGTAVQQSLVWRGDRQFALRRGEQQRLSARGSFQQRIVVGLSRLASEPHQAHVARPHVPGGVYLGACH